MGSSNHRDLLDLSAGHVTTVQNGFNFVDSKTLQNARSKK